MVAIRLILVVILLCALYYLVKKLIQTVFYDDHYALTRKGGDLMQDPVCHAYVPKERAISAQVQGMTHYFCSDQCASEFKGKAA